MTNLLAAVIIAFTFGEIGKSSPEQPNFLIQLSQVSLLHCLSGRLNFKFDWDMVALNPRSAENSYKPFIYV